MNPEVQAIQRLKENFSLLQSYWLQQKEREPGAIYLSLDETLSYLTQSEIPNDTLGSLFAQVALGNPNFYKPDWNWILTVVEIEKFPHPRVSWQLLAVDEKGKIRIFNPIFGFQLQDTQTTLFLGRDRTIIEHRTPEGIESVYFRDRGGRA